MATMSHWDQEHKEDFKTLGETEQQKKRDFLSSTDFWQMEWDQIKDMKNWKASEDFGNILFDISFSLKPLLQNIRWHQQ